ncbi:SRPBCC domain-containing protein [Agromyces sp. NPDC049794]|uniref:SRPBCC domain-containing protein n=1 Tax=unclassified Agromyces TaxID=2639701 RepID=UPI0033E82B0C
MPTPLSGSFTQSARLDVPPSQVFAAFAEPELRRKWFRQPGDRSRQSYRLDFREGGSEVATAVFAPADTDEHIEYDSHFWSIVPDERIVLSYALRLDGVMRWAALRTIVLTPDGNGTKLEWTEQYTFFELTEQPEHDVAHLAGSARLQLNGLAAVLSAQT